MSSPCTETFLAGGLGLGSSDNVAKCFVEEYILSPKATILFTHQKFAELS